MSRQTKIFERRILAFSKHVVKQAKIIAEKSDVSILTSYAVENLDDAVANLLQHAKEFGPEFPMQSLWVAFFSTYYVGSRGKTTEEIEQIVTKMEKIPKTNKRAGAKRGEKLTADAEERWRAKARKIVFETKIQVPNIKQSTLATIIIDKWSHEDEIPPLDSLIKNVIRPIYQCERFINQLRDINPEITREQMLTKIHDEWPHKKKPANFEKFIQDVVDHDFRKKLNN